MRMEDLVTIPAEGDDGDLAGPAADVDDHGPLGLVDRQSGADGSRERLLDGVRLAGPGRLGRLLDGPQFDAGDARRHTHDDARSDERPEEQSLRLNLADKVGEHLLRHLEVGDNAVLQGPHRDDVARRAAEHALRRRANGHDLVSLRVYGDDRGLGEHDPLPLHEHQRVRRSKVYRDVPPEQSSKHTRPILCIERPQRRCPRVSRVPSY